MGILKPNVESKPVASQATPLAGDLLAKLRQAIQGGDPSAGAFGQQQKVTGDLNDFIKSLSNPENFSALIKPVTDNAQRGIQRGAAQVKETNSATGNRFSSSTEKNVGSFVGEQENALNSLISQMFSQQQGNLLGALGLAGNMANSNLEGMFGLAGKGINPNDTVVTDNPWMSLIQGLFRVGGEAAKGAAAGGAA